MNVARDFDDIAREEGGGAILQALDSAQWPWPDSPAPSSDGEGLQLSATPFSWRPSGQIPRRRFLYGFELRRRQLSAVVAPGAAGKTTFKVARALCMVTGRDMLGHRVWDGPHRVWLWNLEDEMEEIERSIHACMKLWNVTADDLGDRLFIDGADSVGSRQLKLATMERTGGHMIRRPVVDALVDELKARRIDYLDVDPFVSSHSVDENDNGAIDAVSKEWVSIATRADCAISLAHHVRKPNGSEATAFDARGAVAMINAARSVLVLQKMSKADAEEFRIPECDRRRYFSVFDDKNNKAPPPSRAEWYEFVSVGLENGDDTGPEDNIGAVRRWQAPDSFGGVTVRQLYHIQNMIRTQPAKSRKHSTSSAWVGKLVAHVLDLNVDDKGDLQRIKKMLGTWLSNGALRSVERADDRREVREYVEVGTWAIVD